MEVMMLEKRSRPLPSGAMQNYPKDWIGDVPDEVASKWIEDDAAVPIAGADGPLFTPDQAFVLRHAANQMIEQINAENAPAEDGAHDPAAGGAGEGDGASDEEDDDLHLDAMSDDELRELAKEAKIKGYASMKRETLIAKLTSTLASDEDGDGDSSTEAE